MQQPGNSSNDERFWRSFASYGERLGESANTSYLPAEWWTWLLPRRAEELLENLPKDSLLAHPDQEALMREAVLALMVCEQEPSNFKGTLQNRLTAMKELVERKGQEYNAGGVSILEYWPDGTANIIHEIRKRALRLLSVGRSRQHPRFEETAEIGLDIAAYSLFLLAYGDVASSSFKAI